MLYHIWKYLIHGLCHSKKLLRCIDLVIFYYFLCETTGKVNELNNSKSSEIQK
jgi:hypothetical protein